MFILFICLCCKCDAICYGEAGKACQTPQSCSASFCHLGGSEVPPETCLVLVGGMLSDQIIHHLAWLTKQMGIKRMLVDAWHN